MCGHIQRFLIPEPQGGARDSKNPDRAKRDRRLLGSQVFWGLTAVGGAWEGHGYTPERGRNFKAHLTVEGSRMKLRGCVAVFRSEEHTSELQSLMRISYAVFCLKKKNIN